MTSVSENSLDPRTFSTDFDGGITSIAPCLAALENAARMGLDACLSHCDGPADQIATTTRTAMDLLVFAFVGKRAQHLSERQSAYATARSLALQLTNEIGWMPVASRALIDALLSLCSEQRLNDGEAS
jgi:hypothetical protein